MAKYQYNTLEEVQKVMPYYEGKRNDKRQIKPGDKFNHLTIIYKTKIENAKDSVFVCQCDCGKYTVVRASNLKSGHTKTCGCIVSQDLTGKRYGRLVVIEKDKICQKGRGVSWKCICDCGNIIHVSTQNLNEGKTKSCGCLNKERIIQMGNDNLQDLTGQKFGHWLVLQRGENLNGQTRWLCECDCQNKTKRLIIASNLKRNLSTSCGCQIASQGIKKIQELLKNENIVFETEKIFSDCKITNYPLRFDIYLPQHNYIIEYDGEHHFKPINYNNISKEKAIQNFKDTQIRDNYKNQWCKKNNIPIIRIPYTHLNKICLKDLQLETSEFIFNKE